MIRLLCGDQRATSGEEEVLEVGGFNVNLKMSMWGPDRVDISKGDFTEDSPAGGLLGAGCQ